MRDIKIICRRCVYTNKDRGKPPLSLFLSRRIQHIFDEDPVAFGGFVDKNVGDGADDLAVLQNGAAAHSLHDPARLGQQLGVGDGDTKVF